MTELEPFDGRSDARLLRLGCAGDDEAFITLYRRHSAPVFRFAHHMSGSCDIAEEVTQEVFTALLDGATQFDGERGPLEAFLIGMARNQVRRHLRQSRELQNFAAPPETTASGSTDPLLEMRLQKLRAAILSLPEAYRAATVLCDLEELSYADAAARLGCAVGTVRSRLHRARAILQAKLRRSETCLNATTTR